MKETKIYQIEKRFKESVSAMRRTDLFIRQQASGRWILTAPHPVDDVEYILSTWENPNDPREFTDVGRCVTTALKAGALSINFQQHPDHRIEP